MFLTEKKFCKLGFSKQQNKQKYSTVQNYDFFVFSFFLFLAHFFRFSKIIIYSSAVFFFCSSSDWLTFFVG